MLRATLWMLRAILWMLRATWWTLRAIPWTLRATVRASTTLPSALHPVRRLRIDPTAVRRFRPNDARPDDVFRQPWHTLMAHTEDPHVLHHSAVSIAQS
eukprot:1434044-Pyramimonas_sp.AAC.1